MGKSQMASSREPTLRVDRSAPADSEESSDEELQCQRCGQMVPTAAELVAHTKVCKRALSKKISNTSYDVLENSTRPTVASRKYTGEDTGGSSSSSQHECSACSKTFRSAKALKIHISRSKPCKTYNATSVPLEQSLSLFRAEDIDPTESSQENNNKWTCESCNRLFESHKGLQTHGRYCKATRQNGDSDARTVVNCGDEGYSDSSLSEETTWICKSCDRPFESQRGLHTHGRYCSGRSSKNEAIDRAGEEVSICAYCRRRFNSAKELQMHSTLCTKNPFNAGSTAAAAAGELFLCDFCDRSFESKKGLKTHGRFCHSRLLATSNAAAVVTPSESSDEPLSSCQRCGRSFDSEKGLKTHERFCNKKKRSGEHSVAPDTSFGTASPPGDGQLKVGEVAWICTSCGRSFESERGLKTHGQFCNESSLSRNAEVFEEVPTSADLANFEKHAATGAHEGHGFVCSACHRSFDSERGLKAHGRFCKDASTTNDTANQTAMTSNDENENVCDSCGRSFDSVRGLQTHSRYCDKPSVTKESADDDSNDAADAVSAATSGTSSDEDHEFVCVACDRSFDSVRGLKTHARYCDNIQAKPAEESNKTDDAIISVVDEGNDTADRDREFTCGLCNRSFNSEKGLKTHSRFCLNVSKINGTAGTAAATSSDDEQTEYEHVCDSCSRSFDSMRGLATHMRFCNTAKESAEDSNEADERVSVGAKEKSESADSKEEEDGERTHQSLALAVQEDSSAVPRTEADSAVVLQRCLHRLRQLVQRRQQGDFSSSGATNDAKREAPSRVFDAIIEANLSYDQVASGPLTALLLQLKRKTSQDVLLQKLAKSTLQRLKAKFRKRHEEAMSAKRQSSPMMSAKSANDTGSGFPDAKRMRKDGKGAIQSSHPKSLSSHDGHGADRDTFVNLLQFVGATNDFANWCSMQAAKAANSSHAYRLLMRGAVEFVHLKNGQLHWDTPQIREALIKQFVHEQQIMVPAAVAVAAEIN